MKINRKTKHGNKNNVSDPIKLLFGEMPLKVEWCKFSEYCIEKNNIGVRCIVPAKNSHIQRIDPFQDFPQVLIKLSNIYNRIGAEEVFNDDFSYNDLNNKKVDDAIIEFVNDYGLFGLLNSKYFSKRFRFDVEIEKATVEAEFIWQSGFYPRIQLNRQGQLPDEIEYGEPLVYIVNAVKELARFIINWANFRDMPNSQYHPFKVSDPQTTELGPLIGDKDINNNFVYLWKHYFGMFSVNNLNIGLEYSNNMYNLKVMDTQLIDILKFAIVINWTTNGKSIQYCQYCKRPFIPSRKGMKFCDMEQLDNSSMNCQLRAKNERQVAERMYSEGKTIDEIVEHFNNRKGPYLSPYITRDVIEEHLRNLDDTRMKRSSSNKEKNEQ